MIEVKRNGKVFYTIEDVCEGSKLSRQLMDHHYIILNFTTVEPVYFEIGDSVEIPDFGYFELISAYFPKQGDNGGYEYELQLDAYYMAWQNKICKYRPQFGANETSFTLTTSVGVHMNVVLGNLKALGYKYNGKDFSVDYTTYNKDTFDVEKRFLIDYDSISILDAITTIAETLECEWWIDGSIIYLGTCEMVGQVTFEQDVNVKSMSFSESKATYITRLYAFGSDRNIPKGYFTGAETDITTDGIATDYLMLPTQEVDEDGFVAKDGYLENVNVVKNPAQAIEGVVMFDEEYPKVECAVSSIKTYDSTVKNDDGTTTTQTFWQVTSNDSFATKFEKNWIKDSLTLMIKFTSGSLLGMEFEVAYKLIDKKNYFEIVANEDYGRFLPDQYLCPKIGDKFFLYNWDATKITDTDLIPKAQLSLLERSKTYYKKSMISNANFDCEMDAEDFYNHGTYDYHPIGEQVKLINPMFADVDKDGKHYRNSRIIGMEINLDIPYDAPTYIVGEKAAYSKLGQLEEKVNSITVNGIQIGGHGSGGGVYVIGINDHTPASDSNVYSARRVRNDFASKLTDNVLQGVNYFLEGIAIGVNKVYNIFKDGVANLFSLHLDDDLVVDGDTHLGQNGTNTDFGNYHADSSGARISVNEDGTSTAEFDYINIRRAAQFRAITIKELRHIGGELAITAAVMVCSKVEKLDNAYKCYFDTSDSENGQQKVFQQFMVGDQARCQQFGLEGTTDDTAKCTRYYWRLVTEVGDDYIVLSDVDKDKLSTSEPQAGDNIVQLGYRYDDQPNRQSALIFSATADDAPSSKHYQGINDYSLDHLVKDEGFDAAKGTFHSNVYGNSYTGDKDGNGYFSYDAKTKEATFKGTAVFTSSIDIPKDSTIGGETKIEDVTTRKDLENLNIRSGNLLRNTSFLGDYESDDVSEDMDISDDTKIFSPNLKYWVVTGAVSVTPKDGIGNDGMAEIFPGTLRQELSQPLLDGEPYTLSFYANGTALTIIIGSMSFTQELTAEEKRYEIHFTNDGKENDFVAIESDNATISDIMLTYGTIAPAWSPAYVDNDKSVAQFQNIKYLFDAITEASTTIDGGLAMTQQIKVGNFRNKRMIKETGGMSGYYNDGNSPYLWGGGTLEQAIRTIQKYKDNPTYEPTEEDLKEMVGFVVTHGGRAILNDIILRGIIYAEGGVMKSIKSPNGNFEIDDKGNAKLKGEINSTKGSMGGFEIGSNRIGSVQERDSEGNIINSSSETMSLFPNEIIFNSKYRQAILGCAWNYVKYLLRLDDEEKDVLTRYGAMIGVRGSTTDNVAIALNGGKITGLNFSNETFGFNDYYISEMDEYPSSVEYEIKRTTNCVFATTRCNWHWKKEDESYYEVKDQQIVLKLPDMKWYDDGHEILIKRGPGNSNVVTIKAQRTCILRDSTKFGEQTTYTEEWYPSVILKGAGDYVTEYNLESEMDSICLRFFKNLTVTIDGTKYQGFWVEFKHPRAW